MNCYKAMALKIYANKVYNLFPLVHYKDESILAAVIDPTDETGNVNLYSD